MSGKRQLCTNEWEVPWRGILIMFVSEEEGNKKRKYVKGLTRTTAPLSSSLPSKNENEIARDCCLECSVEESCRGRKKDIRVMQITEVLHTAPQLCSNSVRIYSHSVFVAHLYHCYWYTLYSLYTVTLLVVKVGDLLCSPLHTRVQTSSACSWTYCNFYSIFLNCTQPCCYQNFSEVSSSMT